MNSTRYPKLGCTITLGLLALAAAGCATRYQFQIDAYTSAEAGADQHSFRLVDAHTPGARGGELKPLAMQCIAAALEQRGLFAANSDATPALEIHVDFGMIGPSQVIRNRSEPNLVPLPHPLAPSTLLGGASGVHSIGSMAPLRQEGSRTVEYQVTSYRKHLHLTAYARAGRDDNDGSHQVWSVFVSNDDASSNLAEYVRLMAVTAVDLIGESAPKCRLTAVTDCDGHVTALVASR